MMRIQKNQEFRSLAYGLNDSESVLACCTLAREKLEVGDYDAGCAALEPWGLLGEWPNQAGLSQLAAAELLLMAGTLSACIASTRQVLGGQKPAEGLLNGAIAIFEQLKAKDRVAEVRIELACCYFWQGLFELSGQTLRRSLDIIPHDDIELRNVALIRLALVEHHA